MRVEIGTFQGSSGRSLAIVRRCTGHSCRTWHRQARSVDTRQGQRASSSLRRNQTMTQKCAAGQAQIALEMADWAGR
eukprot:6184889-Pleurochrysis_carterae.AAC.1